MRYMLALLAFICLMPNGFAADFAVSALPSNPVVIPVAQDFTVSGISLKAPLFVLETLHISWTGETSLVVQAVEFKTNTQGFDYVCAYAGDQLAMLMNGNVILAPPTSDQATVVHTRPLGCGGLPSAVGNEGQVLLFDNYPFDVSVVATSLDSSGRYLDRLTAHTQFVAQ